MPRRLPCDLQLERALLGAMIRDPHLLDTSLLHLEPDHFYSQEHAALLDLLRSMREEGVIVDPLTVASRMAHDDQGERYGGAAYVASLPGYAPASDDLRDHVGLLRHTALLRAFISNYEALLEEAWSNPSDLLSLVERAIQTGLHLVGRIRPRSGADISQVLDRVICRLQDQAERPEWLPGIPTGFVDLDRAMGGLQRGKLTVLGGRPAMGRTTLAINLFRNAAFDGGVGVAFFSLELSSDQLVTRMLCTEAQVDVARVRQGVLGQEDWLTLVRADDRLRCTSMHLDDDPAPGLGNLLLRARMLKLRDPTLGLVVIDDLQRLTRGQRTGTPSVPQALASLAQELEVAVLVVSQLGHRLEYRVNRRPILSDLLDEGELEQAAHAVLLLYRDEYYNPESRDKGLAEVLIVKNDSGPTRTVRLVFRGPCLRFDSYQP